MSEFTGDERDRAVAALMNMQVRYKYGENSIGTVSYLGQGVEFALMDAERVVERLAQLRAEEPSPVPGRVIAWETAEEIARVLHDQLRRMAAFYAEWNALPAYTDERTTAVAQAKPDTYGQAVGHAAGRHS